MTQTKLLKNQLIPRDLPRQNNLIFIGEKPSLYFHNHPDIPRQLGNYNVTATDFVFHNWIRKYIKKSVYVTDMVKTEGRAGANFLKEWDKNRKFKKILLWELKKINPKVVVLMSKKVEKLFLSEDVFQKWHGKIIRVYHPSYVVRYNRFKEWDKQWQLLIKNLRQ